MSPKVVNNRDSKYEIIRIVAAIAITLNHIPCSPECLPINYYVRHFFFLGGQFGVNLFVIVGAWFLCDGAVRSRQVVRIGFQMLFYSLSLDLLLLLMGHHFTVASFFKSFSYWFCFGYVVMVLLTPFLKRISTHWKCVVAAIGIIFASAVTVGGYYDSSLLFVRLSLKGLFIGPVWFSYVFIVISILKPKWEIIKLSRTAFFFIFLVSLILMYTILLTFQKSYIREVCSPVCFVCSLSMFGFLTSHDVRQNQFINRLAGYTFGVYLLQAHMLLREYIWEGIFHFTKVSEISIMYFFEGLLAVAVILIMSSVTEELRNRFMLLGPIKKLMNLISSLLDYIYSLLLDTEPSTC